MKNKNLPYWIVTVLFAAFIILTAVMDVLKTPDAVKMIAHLGYPEYLLPFLGVMKIAGALTLFASRFPRLREWAYAGLAIDMTGALYSHLNVGDSASVFGAAVIGLCLLTASYILLQRKTSR